MIGIGTASTANIASLFSSGGALPARAMAEKPEADAEPRPFLPRASKVSADQAYDTLKMMRVLEGISGKATDPQIKFDLVKRAAPAYMDDVARGLADLPLYSRDNTRSTEEKAQETFERIEVFTWALSSSLKGLADRDGFAMQIQQPLTGKDIASQLFDLMDKASEAAEENQVADSNGKAAEVRTEPKVHGPLGGVIAALNAEGGPLNDSFIASAPGIEALAARDDDFALIGQAAAVFAYAASIYIQNPDILGDDTAAETEKRLERIFIDIKSAAFSMMDLQDRNGALPSQRFDMIF
ncbi:hypothetical protein FF098_013835 [Parvularcula flava]|uniref:Uncharacterized protein n=1 Tax=Aquisalinus luteolus TaxID=1566827 RepID=A0A8J3EVH9_9PROT|nr:hypothetical protein [Aquisalinus luteolus]NHK28999.1 hypothetical protein [Aquisalinus luteolus]GGI00619.1 hypothetical protein GCM10011355_29340 [Aquisalinus luteolus]